MAKSVEILAKYLDDEHDKDYLQDLLLNLHEVYEHNKTVRAIVVAMTETGFRVKMKGLCSHIFYDDMPWRYRHRRMWDVVGPYFLGTTIDCKVKSIDDEKIIVKLNAIKKPSAVKDHLTIGEHYKGVVLKRQKSGFVCDMGLHFDWRYGSLKSLVRYKHLSIPEDFMGVVIGQEVELPCLGFKGETVIFGTDLENAMWYTGEMNVYKNSIQKLYVTIDSEGVKHYHVNGLHLGHPVYFVSEFGYSCASAEAYVDTLTHNQVVLCKIMDTSMSRKGFVFRFILPEEDLQTVLVTAPIKARSAALLAESTALEPTEEKAQPNYWKRMGNIFNIRPSQDYNGATDLSIHLQH